jgi:hypothetical protein
LFLGELDFGIMFGSVIGTGVFFSGPKTRFFFRLEPETRTMGPVSLGVKQKIKPIYFRNHHQMLAAVVHRRLLMMTRPSGPHFQLVRVRRNCTLSHFAGL